MVERTADIAIVGAGLAGLRCADRLVREGHSVVVIEANDRIGGRMVSQPVDPRYSKGDSSLVVDGGAQFIGGTHTKMLELVEELNMNKFPASREKDGNFRWAQEIGPWFRFGLSPDTSEPHSFEAVREETEALAATVPLDAPWTAPNAAELDSQTFGHWLHKTKRFPKSACVPFERLCKMHLGCDPNVISLLYMLFLLHSCGGYNRIVKHEEGGAHQWRIQGGSWQICQRLAERIGADKILLASPVTEIHHNDHSVEIRGDKFHVKAERIVITLQPQLCQKIRFEPPLNNDRNALQEQYLTKRPFTAKTHLIYDRPFWRDQGYSGTGVASSGVVFVDNSPPPIAEGEDEVGILLAFRDTRRRDLTHAKLKCYAKTLFGKEAAHPRQVIEQDWSVEEWSASCISHTPPGLLSKHGKALREPIGRIYWAGAETSPEWPSFMEGAVRSADRVFEEMIQQDGA